MSHTKQFQKGKRFFTCCVWTLIWKLTKWNHDIAKSVIGKIFCKKIAIPYFFWLYFINLKIIVYWCLFALPGHHMNRTNFERKDLDAVVELQLSTKVSHIQSSLILLSSTCTTLHKWTQQCVIVSKTVLFPSVDFFFAELCISGKAKIVSSSLNKFDPVCTCLNKIDQFGSNFKTKQFYFHQWIFFAELCISQW